MTKSKTPAATWLVAVVSFSLMGAGKYGPQMPAAPEASAPELWGQNSFPGASEGTPYTAQYSADFGRNGSPRYEKPRGPGGLTNKRQECYDKSYRCRLNKRRCCQLLHGESYYEPDPPYCHPSFGYHETLWRRFPEEALISGQYSGPESFDEQPELGTTPSSPMQNRPVEQPPAQDPHGMPTPAAPSVSPPTPSIPTPAAPPAPPVPMSPEGAAYRPDSRHSVVQRVIPAKSPAYSRGIPLPVPVAVSVTPVRRTPVPQTVVPTAPTFEQKSQIESLTPPPLEFIAPPAEPIRRISHDLSENQPPQSSQGWHARRK